MQTATVITCDHSHRRRAARVHSSHRRPPGYAPRMRDIADVPGRLPIPRERVGEGSTHRQRRSPVARPTHRRITSARPRVVASDLRARRIAELCPHARQRKESRPRRSHSPSPAAIHERDKTESAPTQDVARCVDSDSCRVRRVLISFIRAEGEAITS